MFGNNGMQFAPQDWQQMALMAGLSMLGNNDGSRSVGQLIGQGGLDALAGIQARKQYEAAMAQKRAEAEANKWHMDTTNGMMIDKTTGTAKPIVGWKGKPSSDMERYLAMSPEDRKTWDNRELAMKLAGSTKINNNLGAGFEPAFSKKEGERASNYLGSLEEQYLAAGKRLADYDALDSLYDRGLKTGWSEDFKNEVAKKMAALGFDQQTLDSLGFQNIANVEAFKSLQARATMNALLDQKGVQTEGDSQRASKTWAEIGNTPEGNKWINQYARNVANREREKVRFLRNEMRKNGNDIIAADEAWEEHLKSLPSVVPDAPKVSTPATIKNGNETQRPPIAGFLRKR
jgi:hypothetical protein